MSFDPIFGAPATALMLREKRAAVLANNLVNGSTPNYKARDIDFRSAMNGAIEHQQKAIVTTSDNHISLIKQPARADLLYRVPLQPSLDGNTVDSNIEQAQFSENAVQYMINLTFVRGTYRNLMSAIRGE